MTYILWVGFWVLGIIGGILLSRVAVDRIKVGCYKKEGENDGHIYFDLTKEELDEYLKKHQWIMLRYEKVETDQTA